MKRLFVLAALLMGCALIAGACGGSETGSAVPSGWVTFEGESISLALPDSFVGGDLGDPAVFAALEEAAAANPNPGGAQVMGLTLRSLQSQWEESGFELWMLGEADADGQMPVVQAGRGDMPANTSLEAWIEEYTAGFADHDWTVESVTEDQAYVVERWEGTDWAVLRHWAFRAVGPYLYRVSCMFEDASNTALEAVFRQSAATIVVKEQ